MPLTDAKKLKYVADSLSGLAEPSRVRIIETLLDGPKSVGEIAKAIGAKLVNTSHHMNVLRAADLVEFEKKGRFMFYSLNPKFVTKRGVTTLDLGWCKVYFGK